MPVFPAIPPPAGMTAAETGGPPAATREHPAEAVVSTVLNRVVKAPAANGPDNVTIAAARVRRGVTATAAGIRSARNPVANQCRCPTSM
jgi:hypothetical protein